MTDKPVAKQVETPQTNFIAHKIIIGSGSYLVHRKKRGSGCRRIFTFLLFLATAGGGALTLRGNP